MKRIGTALITILTIAASLAGQVPTSGSAVLKSIGYVKTYSGLEISVRLEGDFVHQVSVLTSPNRLVIDFAPSQKIEARPIYDVNAFGVTTVRTGQFQPQISRVIIDFSGPVPAYDIQKSESGLTVKIGLAPKPVEKPAAAAVFPPPVQEIKPAQKEEAPEAGVEAESLENPPGFYNTTAGFTIGTYKSPDDRFKEVYGDQTNVQLGINLSRTLLYLKGFQLDISFEARILSLTGKSTLSGDEAKFRMIPLTLGGRLLYQTKYIIPFLGGGLDWYNYKEDSVLASTSGSASGYHFQGGVFVVIPNLDCLRVKLYYKYTKVSATENEIDVQLGGPEYGIGLSFGFNFLNKVAFIIQ
jgi:hypothetical protein